MKTIVEALSDLLFVRDIVVVPGMGAFIKTPTSAQVNHVANYFSAPSCVIEFDNKLREDNDLIINFIATENNISNDEARRLLAIFVSDCFSKLKDGKEVVLEGIGTLYYDWHSDILLKQNTLSNFNSDAFGLTDFIAIPKAHLVTKDEIKVEIEQQQKEKNTPVTVDEKLIHEEEKRTHHRVWPWILLILFILTGTAFALQYFHLFDFRSWMRPQTPVVVPIDTITESENPIESIPLRLDDSVVESEMDSVALADTLIQVEDTEIVTEQPVEEIKPVDEVSLIEEEARIMIVAGCFSMEENANSLVNKLKEQGYVGAFAEQHGSKWFVAYGRYRTNEEASEALTTIKANDQKAWIRK